MSKILSSANDCKFVPGYQLPREIAPNLQSSIHHSTALYIALYLRGNISR